MLQRATEVNTPAKYPSQLFFGLRRGVILCFPYTSTDGIGARIAAPDDGQDDHQPPAALRQMTQIKQVRSKPAEIDDPCHGHRKIKRSLIAAALKGNEMNGHGKQDKQHKERNGSLVAKKKRAVAITSTPPTVTISFGSY